MILAKLAGTNLIYPLWPWWTDGSLNNRPSFSSPPPNPFHGLFTRIQRIKETIRLEYKVSWTLGSDQRVKVNKDTYGFKNQLFSFAACYLNSTGCATTKLQHRPFTSGQTQVHSRLQWRLLLITSGWMTECLFRRWSLIHKLFHDWWWKKKQNRNKIRGRKVTQAYLHLPLLITHHSILAAGLLVQRFCENIINSTFHSYAMTKTINIRPADLFF